MVNSPWLAIAPTDHSGQTTTGFTRDLVTAAEEARFLTCHPNGKKTIIAAGFDEARPDEQKKFMTTMTLKEAQTNLGELCQRAKDGEDVGIVSGRQVLRLVPTKMNRQNAVVLIPMTEAYVAKEYGVAPAEFAQFKKRLERRYREEKRRGLVKRFSGDLEKDIQD